MTYAFLMDGLSGLEPDVRERARAEIDKALTGKADTHSQAARERSAVAMFRKR